jgi:hypothetical protein
MRNASLAPVIRNAESKKFTFLGSRHRALASLTFKWSLSVRNRLIEALTLSPAWWLRT